MTFFSNIPGTDITVSRLGLGTVKIGRDQQVKYPNGFTIPDDKQVSNLLCQARDLGINLIDTAPAYGNSEARLGQLLPNRHDWVICTKVGEEFENGVSRFNYSSEHTRLSLERSLVRLNTDYMDIVLIHSDGNDIDILQNSGCLETLRAFQQKGLIKAIGMSTKTERGGKLAAELTDIVMLTYNLNEKDQEALDFAANLKKGILIKKGLASGHRVANQENGVEASLRCIFSQPAVNSAIIGTINTTHLAENVSIARKILAST